MPVIEQLVLQPYRLPLARRWRTAGTGIQARRGWLLRLGGAGRTGYGDCAPLDSAGTGSHAECAAWWSQGLERLRGRRLQDALSDMPLLHEAPAAVRCAIEGALLDLQAHMVERPLRTLLDASARDSVPVNAMIGALDADTARHARAAEAAGFRVLKLKIGMQPPAETLARLRRLADGLAQDTRLRLDANRAWRLEDGLPQFLEGLAELPVAGLSQLCDLQQGSPVPIGLDESLAFFPADELLDALPGGRLILKPMALGGLRPSLELAHRACTRGLASLCTSVVESSAGLWNTAQLAACLGDENALPAQGLATSAWLARDLGVPPTIRDGILRLSSRPGSGFMPYDPADTPSKDTAAP